MQNNIKHDMLAPAPPSMPPAAVPYYSSDFEEGFHLRDCWHILKKRKWWFLGVMGGLVSLTILVMLIMDPIYKVTTTLQIVQDNPSAIMGGSSSDPLAALTGSSELDMFYETQNNILLSPSLAYGIIDSLKLQEHPSYRQMQLDYPKDPPEVIRQRYVQYILDRLKVDPIRNSFLVNVSFQSTDKVLAQKIPDTIQKEYLKLAMTTRQQSYAMLREWLDNMLVSLGKKLEFSEQSVYQHGQKQDSLSLEENAVNVIVQKYVDLNKLLTVSQSDKASKEALYRQIKEKGADAPVITNHPLITQLRQQLIDIEAQMTGSKKIFGPKYPEHSAQVTRTNDLRRRLNTEVARLEVSVKSDYEAASRAEQLIRQEFEQAKGKVIGMQDDLVKHHVLTRDLQTNQTLYEGLLARMKEANVTSTMVPSNVSVITPAELPYDPWMPKPLLFIAIAVVLGSMFGGGAAFFMEYLDSSIKTTEEMEKICHIPSLGVVPYIDAKELAKEKLTSSDLITYARPQSMAAEAISHIRTSIMLSVSEMPPQAIIVTSANPDEGKSTVSLNLAAAMANSETKCLLIDCDLRKPSINKFFQQPLQPGLTNYLTGTATLEEIIRPTDVPNLFFIPAGPNPPNPNELLGSAAFKRLLNELRQEFHQLIIDSPPIIGFSDARAIAVNVDGVLLVFKHHCTTREAGRLAIHLLAQNNCRILGGILTMARKDRLGYGAYYGYYQYYHKYYDKYREAGEQQVQSGRS
jgi:polysaccharide biosynthesis transport protein